MRSTKKIVSAQPIIQSTPSFSSLASSLVLYIQEDNPNFLKTPQISNLRTCWLTFSSSMSANCVRLWSLVPALLLAADGCRLRGRSCSGVAGDSTTLPPCGGEGVTTLNRPNVATPDWLLRSGAGFWWASDVDFAEATVSLSNFSGGWSRWDVALLLGAEG